MNIKERCRAIATMLTAHGYAAKGAKSPRYNPLNERRLATAAQHDDGLLMTFTGHLSDVYISAGYIVVDATNGTVQFGGQSPKSPLLFRLVPDPHLSADARQAAEDINRQFSAT